VGGAYISSFWEGCFQVASPAGNVLKRPVSGEYRAKKIFQKIQKNSKKGFDKVADAFYILQNVKVNWPCIASRVRDYETELLGCIGVLLLFGTEV